MSSLIGTMIDRIIKNRSFKRAVITAVIIVFVLATDIGCPIRYVTGISCPGCGITRAFVACFRLDFLSAFHYYPMIVTFPVVIIYIAMRNKLPDRIKKVLMYVYIGAFIVVYVARMADSHDNVVVFRLSEGLFGRLFS